MRTDYFNDSWVGLAQLKDFFADMENVHRLISYLIVNFTNQTLPKWNEPEVAGIENYMKLRGHLESKDPRNEQYRKPKGLKRDKTLYPGSDLEAFYMVITEGLFKHRDKRVRKSPVKKAKKSGYDGPALRLRSSSSGRMSTRLGSPESTSN